MCHRRIYHHPYFSFAISILTCLLSGFMQVKAQQPSWNATGSLGEARTRHTATLLANGKVLVVGGLSIPTPCCRTATSAELYDPATGLWSVTGSPINPRYDHVAVRLANGKVLITDGSGVPSTSPISAEIYDPDTGTWSAAATPSFLRIFPQAPPFSRPVAQ